MYYVYEGLDFSGKSTLATKHAKRIKAKLVAEPFTGSKALKLLKEKLVSNTLTKDQEIAGYAEARVEAFKQVIQPFLKHSRDVISDRNVVSSMVYQSDEHVGMEEVLDINRKLLRTYGFNVLPDVVYFIDIEHETFLERLEAAKANGRAVDNKDLMFQDKEIFEQYRTKYKKALKILQTQHKVVVHILTAEQATLQHVLNLELKEAA